MFMDSGEKLWPFRRLRSHMIAKIWKALSKECERKMVWPSMSWAGNANPSAAATIHLSSRAATGLSPRRCLGPYGLWARWGLVGLVCSCRYVRTVTAHGDGVSSLPRGSLTNFLTLVSKPKVCRHRSPAMVHRRRRDLAPCRLVMFTAKV
jgi:hypothetical protein